MKQFDKDNATRFDNCFDSEGRALDQYSHYYAKRVDPQKTLWMSSNGNGATIVTASGSYDDAYDGLYAFFHGKWLVGMDFMDLDLAVLNETNVSAVYCSKEYSADGMEELSSFVLKNMEVPGTFLICIEGKGFLESISVLRTLFPKEEGDYLYNAYDRADGKQVIRVFCFLKQ